jgi:hypothetical protein
MKPTAQTEAAQTEPKPTGTNNHTPIELSIVEGETSGIFRIDERTGSVEFAEDITYEQWKVVLRTARTIKRKAAIVVADCISIGVKKWGRKKVDDALEQLELEAILVKTAIAINSVPRELRLENLDGEHYIELSRAQLPKAKAIRWARITSEQRLTPAQLRLSITQGEVIDRSAERMLRSGVTTIHGIRQSFDVWYRRVGGINGLKAMSSDEKIDIMEELDFMVEVGVLLHDHLEDIHKETTNEATPDAARA